MDLLWENVGVINVCCYNNKFRIKLSQMHNRKVKFL